jgi:hypothetical protein
MSIYIFLCLNCRETLEAKQISRLKKQISRLNSAFWKHLIVNPNGCERQNRLASNVFGYSNANQLNAQK